MATSSFPIRKDFAVLIGDNNEGINLTVTGGATDNFTGYTMLLSVKCPNNAGFSRSVNVTASPVNVALASFVLTTTEMAKLGEGGSNFYSARLISGDGTWSKTAFQGTITGILQ